jgi:hypothetical protein
MLVRLAVFTLNLHILKRLSQLGYFPGLRYLRYSRMIHGALIPISAMLAIVCAIGVVGTLCPSFTAKLPGHTPVTDLHPEPLFSLIFFLLGAFCGTMFCTLFVTRELLARYWLLLFLVHQRKLPVQID